MTEDLQTRAREIYAEHLAGDGLELDAADIRRGDTRASRTNDAALRCLEKAMAQITTLTAERDAALARVEAMREALVSIRETAETREYSGRVGGATLWREGLVSIFAKARAALAPPSGAMDREEGTNG